LEDLGRAIATLQPDICGPPSSAWHRIVVHAHRLAGFTPEVGFASDD